MTNYQTTQSGLSFLIRTLREYQSPSFYLYAAAVLLVVLAVCGGRRMRSIFFWPLLILAATAFNPYIFPLMLDRRSTLVEQYYSFLWMIPVPLIMAAGLTALAGRFRRRWERGVLLLVGLCALILGGTPQISSYEGLETPANYMKADAELVTICEYIRTNSGTDSPCIAFEEPAFAEEALALCPELTLSDLFSGDGGRLETRGEDFIVIDKSSVEHEAALKAAGYRAIAHTPDSYVFAPADSL